MSKTEIFSSKLLGEHYCKVTHDSGLTIYVFPKEMSTVYGILSVNFGGSVSEYVSNGEKIEIPQGCAHFLEHKMFDNDDKSNADDIFSSLGAYDNAYTSSERTAYMFSATDNITECIEQLLYFVTHPYFTKKTVKKEIGIIAEEIRGCLDDPYDRCYTNLLDAMYVSNPVKNEICGSEESISRITPEILYKCCKDFYVPSNMILCLSGKITADEVIAIADRIMGKIRRDCGAVLPESIEPEAVKSSYTEKLLPVSKPLFCIGIKDCDIPQDPRERYKKNEGMTILLNTMFSESSDFYLEMLEQGLLSPGFDCGYSSNSKTAYVMMSGDSEDPKLLLEKVKERIKKSRADGVSRESFAREKKCLYASYISDFDMTEDIAFALTSYAYDNVGLFEYPEIIDGITVEYVTELLNTAFDDEYFSLSVVRPE